MKSISGDLVCIVAIRCISSRIPSAINVSAIIFHWMKNIFCQFLSLFFFFSSFLSIIPRFHLAKSNKKKKINITLMNFSKKRHTHAAFRFFFTFSAVIKASRQTGIHYTFHLNMKQSANGKKNIIFDFFSCTQREMEGKFN